MELYNSKVTGPSPAPATKKKHPGLSRVFLFYSTRQIEIQAERFCEVPQLFCGILPPATNTKEESSSMKIGGDYF
jgi:hypothetical protein